MANSEITAHMRALPVQLAKYAEALRLKEQGLTHRQVGEHFGVKAERARQLVAMGRRRRSFPSAWNQLSVRAVNVLYNQRVISDKSELDQNVIAQASARALSRTPNCGQGTVNDINAWLKQYGLQLQP